MTWKIYIKAEDGNFVMNTTPLDFTGLKSKAWCSEVLVKDLDADYIEALMEYISQVVNQSDTMTWNLYIETDEEEPVATVKFDEEKLECEMHTHEMATSVKVRKFCADLSDYLTALALARAAKAAFTKVPTGGGGDTLSGSEKLAPEDPVEKIIAEIEHSTKASIVRPKETLADYVCDATLKEELTEIVEFFSKRDVYVKAGVRIPKGILFKGIPGTGKTYAARCIAGTVDCYFMSCTASSLQGMYVGSGAENVRGIFKGAKKLFDVSGKGVIVFIDELDSFGNRDNHSGGAGSEEDRTLNQLLAEMSGFEDNDNIMVLAATNYPERLDDALMRSGRFSRQICIEAPDEIERNALVEYYYDKLHLDYGYDCSSADVAALTEGMTAADIAEIMNEAGILTIRRGEDEIMLDAVNEAINKCITKNIRRPDKSKTFHWAVAVHEAGHVLAEWIYQGTYSVKVTNYSYGDAGGFTQPQKSTEPIVTRESYRNEIMCLLGGRAAEEVIMGHISTGASGDLKRVIEMIKAYYKVYHFEQYDTSKFDQVVEDTLHEMYNDCVCQLSSQSDVLRALVKALETERVLYTADIIRVIDKEIEE